MNIFICDCYLFLEYLPLIKKNYSNVSIYYYCFTNKNNHNINQYIMYIDTVYYKTDEIYRDIIINMDQVDKNKYIDKFKKIIIVTFGTFDLYHIGHQRIFERALDYGEIIVVGVSSDTLNTIKGKKSFQNIDERINKIKTTNMVQSIFIEESLELKNDYIKQHNGNIMIMGDDWIGKFDWVDCLTIYLPRTPDISSTMLREQIISVEYNS